MNELFETGKKIIKILNGHGFQGYFVGGCVRDVILKRTVNDIDITTDALPADIESIFEKTIDVGKEHGTIIVVMDDSPCEVTTFRVESDYSDHRRPDSVTFTNELTGDLKRRDFTINAMAMNEDYQLTDPFSGREDLDNRLLRTVGNPDERFDEDALRILRAVRFMAQLDFSIAMDTVAAMTRKSPHLKHVAVERKLVELRKIYGRDNILHVKHMLVSTGVKKEMPFLCEISDNDFLNVIAHSLSGEAAIQIYHHPDIEEKLSELKISNEEKSMIKNMTALLNELNQERDAIKLSYLYSPEVISTVKTLIEINGSKADDRDCKIQLLIDSLEQSQKLPIKKTTDININGRQLMKYFNQEGGIWIKELLGILEEEILYNRLENDYDKIVKWIDANVEIETGNIKVN
ncbi:CCA tRNA nucleotidyltransferase [Salinicoccus albus]|uniref:CCA tRNA nucleotidyltransferase n=1 Tax=Salinicoccus albus TaxID=418756 RepID=UPI0003777AA1|nr:CCA tRNA nucleotidyltransferase [Salinicoccus albus]